MTSPARPRPIVLVVLDGFGIGPTPADDAIASAAMPIWRGLIERWPHAVLGASEEAVGLPPGQMGNSEVGHLNLGAGRPVLQDLPRIDAAIDDGSFFERPALIAACARAAHPDGRLHVVSLIGPGGVHANDRHLVALAELAARHGVPAIRVHALLDGRDTPPRSALIAACARAAHPDGRLHVVSLIGPGGVHANDRQLVALAELAARRGVPAIRVHALLDGRDTPPRSALLFVVDVEARLTDAHPDARIATIGGRYYAMDRDKRWERVAKGYDAIVHGVGLRASSPIAAIEAGYGRNESDEFLTPTVIDGIDGRVRDRDPIIHANFRADRARELIHALTDPDDTFTGFDRTAHGARPRDVLVVTMTEYEAGLPVEVAFPPEEVRSLAHAASDAGWTQFHVAETEKYAHVTYFFNGGREAPLPGEDRRLVPSPKVATYDLQPEMSAPGVTDALVEALGSGRYDLIVANYANADMVGHTGVWDAAIRAVETLDACLGRVIDALAEVDARDPTGPGSLLAITADHGNADEMRNDAGQPVTAHSLNPVPIVLVGRVVDGRRLRDGVLADVAPTLLELAGLPGWEGMTGRSLLVPRDAGGDRAGADREPVSAGPSTGP